MVLARPLYWKCRCLRVSHSSGSSGWKVNVRLPANLQLACTVPISKRARRPQCCFSCTESVSVIASQFLVFPKVLQEEAVLNWGACCSQWPAEDNISYNSGCPRCAGVEGLQTISHRVLPKSFLLNLLGQSLSNLEHHSRFWKQIVKTAAVQTVYSSSLQHWQWRIITWLVNMTELQQGPCPHVWAHWPFPVSANSGKEETEGNYEWGNGVELRKKTWM